MFTKRRRLDPVDKATDRQDMDEVKDRLAAVERRVTILTYQLKVMRRETSTGTGGMV